MKSQITYLEQHLLQKHSPSSFSDQEEQETSNIQRDASTKFINILERITYQQWHINIIIVIDNSFKLQTTALVDSCAQLNYIQEGLVPTQFFQKTKERLTTVNGKKLNVKWKITDTHNCNEGIYLKQTFILVKDLDIGIILGQPFLEIIKPFKVKSKGITTKLLGRKTLFTFNERPISKDINLLKALSLLKEHSIS
ncbi:hypothetical protein CFOL_v3_22641 [Cephalotus follicularis]|uniref:Retropepsins domain-containing protein n=1 Tax=Cephalotus follicularis TaxID=3775 RepID=A0A1Q3CFY4_CEPFO|nr:hypothetical protein CFOL_v3_22641 [Cephalotus follicularis]